MSSQKTKSVTPLLSKKPEWHSWIQNGNGLDTLTRWKMLDRPLEAQGQVKGVRSVGRPKHFWRDDIVGQQETAWTRIAKDRESWGLWWRAASCSGKTLPRLEQISVHKRYYTSMSSPAMCHLSTATGDTRATIQKGQPVNIICAFNGDPSREHDSFYICCRSAGSNEDCDGKYYAGSVLILNKL